MATHEPLKTHSPLTWPLLNWPHQLTPKKLRSRWIVRHAEAAGYRGLVCFSCGNAGHELQIAAGALGKLNVLHIGPHGALNTHEKVWFNHAEIHQHWPDYFDATSGHLPLWAMAELCADYREALGMALGADHYDVPTGSGETVLILRWAYPGVVFRAAYDNSQQATSYDDRHPLNAVVAATGPVVRRGA